MRWIDSGAFVFLVGHVDRHSMSYQLFTRIFFGEFIVYEYN